MDIVDQLKDFASCEDDEESADFLEEAAEEITRLRAQLAEEEIDHGKVIAERDYWETKAAELANDIGEALGFDVGEHSNMNCPVQNAIDDVAEMRSQIDDWHKLAEVEGQEPVGHVERDIGCGTYELHAYRAVEEFAKLYTHPAPAKVPEGYALVPVEPTDEMIDAMIYAKRDMEQMQVWDARAAMTEVYQVLLKSQGGE